MGNREIKNRKRKTRAKNGLSFKYSVEASICRISTDDESRNSWIKSKKRERDKKMKKGEIRKTNNQTASSFYSSINRYSYLHIGLLTFCRKFGEARARISKTASMPKNSCGRVTKTGYPGFLWSTGRRGCIEDGQVNGPDSSQLDLRLRISSYVHIGSWRSSIAAIHLMYEVICLPLKNIEMEFDNRLAKAECCTALHIRYAQYEGTLDVQFFSIITRAFRFYRNWYIRARRFPIKDV